MTRRFFPHCLTQTHPGRIYQGARRPGRKVTRMLLRISALVAVALAAGCMNGGIDADEPPTGAVQQAFSGSSTCQEWLCGTNSPEIANFGFWDLNLPPSLGTPGKRNNADFQLLYFVQKGDKYLPKVAEGRLTASNSTGTLSGSALVGGWLVLVRGSRNFKLGVTGVGRAVSWAHQPGKPLVVLESYKLDWTEFTAGSNGKEFV